MIVGQKYRLHEVEAPNGYLLADDVEFTVEDTSKVQSVKMKDIPTETYVTKTDITGKKEVIGATLRVSTLRGRLVDETGDEYTAYTKPDGTHCLGHVTKSNGRYYLMLPEGKYTLTELGLKVNKEYIIPERFAAPEPVNFEISADSYKLATESGYQATYHQIVAAPLKARRPEIPYHSIYWQNPFERALFQFHHSFLEVVVLIHQC